MGGIGLSSGKNCTVGRLVANPWASQQHDGGRVVEIGGIGGSSRLSVNALIGALRTRSLATTRTWQEVSAQLAN